MCLWLREHFGYSSPKLVACNFRPIINGKFEEKTCGEGPSLATMFDDDRHLQGLVSNIRVSKCTHNFTAEYRICNPSFVILVGVCYF